MKNGMIKVNGTNFNKEHVSAMTKEQFVKRFTPISDVMPYGDKEKREQMLNKAYDEVTAKPDLKK